MRGRRLGGVSTMRLPPESLSVVVGIPFSTGGTEPVAERKVLSHTQSKFLLTPR